MKRLLQRFCVLALTAGLCLAATGCDDDEEDVDNGVDTVMDTAGGDTVVADTGEDTVVTDTGEDTAVLDTGEDTVADVPVDTVEDTVADTVEDTTGAEPLPMCTIDFDGVCPNVTAQCSTSFSGGGGCLTVGLFNCYSSGAFGYAVGDGQTVDITFAGGVVNSVEVFFAAQGTAGTGTLTFFAADDTEVGSVTTNGDCTDVMPPLQTVTLSAPAVRATATSSGGTSWIDDFTVNP